MTARRPRRRRALAGAAGATCALTLALAAAAPGRAEARIIDLRAGARAGGIVGWGSTANTPDFFNKTRGAGLGFEIGAKLLIFDASASFLQVFNGDGTVGTLTQFLLGIAIDVPLGPAPGPRRTSPHVLRPGFVTGFGFGTPGPVDPPLDNSQISDKGIVADGRIGYEYFINPFVGVGGQADFGYHYFLGGDVVTSSQDHSSGFHMSGLGTVTFHLGY